MATCRHPVRALALRDGSHVSGRINPDELSCRLASEQHLQFGIFGFVSTGCFA
jgi:hypothetical protein